MKEFRCIEDVERFESSGESKRAAKVIGRVVRDFVAALAEYGVDWDPDSDGVTVLVEPGDSGKELEERYGYSLQTATWEGVVYEDGFWVGACIHNNSYGVTYCIEDAPWLDPSLRAKLQAECADGARP